MTVPVKLRSQIFSLCSFGWLGYPSLLLFGSEGIRPFTTGTDILNGNGLCQHWVLVNIPYYTILRVIGCSGSDSHASWGILILCRGLMLIE
jgi:hypothetical protein